MQRRLRITLAASAAAGIALLATGTAHADGIFRASGDKVDCTRSLDKGKPLKEDDFPSDHNREADQNATKLDARDSRGNVYYTHNAVCDAPRPWRGYDWHDDSYDTFHYQRDPGSNNSSRDHHKNTYLNDNGYNNGYHYDEKQLEPDHIGAKKNPKHANE